MQMPVRDVEAKPRAPLLYVPLTQLAFDPGANVRKTARDPSPALRASIEAKGIIVPLIVRDVGTAKTPSYAVADGGKRLAVLRELAAAGKIAADEAVPARVVDAGDGDARALSLTAAIIRDDLHPVDSYEAFSQMVADGATSDGLVRDFAMSTHEVRQVLALGALSPKIREAWRAGEIDAEAAKRFTLAKDHKHQDSVFARLKKQQGRVSEWSVREAFATKDHDVGRLVMFVGADAYRKAGGTLIEDLFGSASNRSDVVNDVPLLRRLADEKLADVRASLIAEGWAWAESEQTNDRYMMARLPRRDPKLSKEEAAEHKRLRAEMAALQKGIDDDDGSGDDAADDPMDRFDALRDRITALEEDARRRAYTADEKAKAGCFVTVGHDGSVDIEIGYIKGKGKRPATGRELADRGGKKVPRKADFISDALTSRLAEQLTKAAATALASHRRLGLAVLLAGIKSGDYHVGIHVTTMQGVDGSTYTGNASKRPALDAAIAALDEADEAALMTALVGVAGVALNFKSSSYGKGAVASKEVKAIVDRLPPAALNQALAAAFDAEDYFASVSATVARAALKEMDVDLPASAKKPAIATAGVAAARESGWLPKELRTIHYARDPGSPGWQGPKQAAKGKAAKAKPSKAKAAKAKPAKGKAKVETKAPAKKRGGRP